MRALIIAGLGLALAACGTVQPSTVAQDAEKADSAALASYAATGSVLDVLEAQAKASGKPIDSYEAIRVKAWNDLQLARIAIKAGQAVSMAALQADNAAANAAASTPTVN